MYLDEEIVGRQLRELHESSAIGSRLASDSQPPPGRGTRKNRRQLLLQRVARIGSGEGFRFLVDRSAAVALVEGSGWSVTEATSTRYACASPGLRQCRPLHWSDQRAQDACRRRSLK